jgi:hypothetical protein
VHTHTLTAVSSPVQAESYAALRLRLGAPPPLTIPFDSAHPPDNSKRRLAPERRTTCHRPVVSPVRRMPPRPRPPRGIRHPPPSSRVSPSAGNGKRRLARDAAATRQRRGDPLPAPFASVRCQRPSRPPLPEPLASASCQKTGRIASRPQAGPFRRSARPDRPGQPHAHRAPRRSTALPCVCKGRNHNCVMITNDFHLTKDFPFIKGKSFVITGRVVMSPEHSGHNGHGGARPDARGAGRLSARP